MNPVAAGLAVAPKYARHEISPTVQRELWKYPGQWAAITRTKLIAIGSTPKRVLAKAQAEGYQSPILYRVPHAGEVWCL